MQAHYSGFSDVFRDSHQHKVAVAPLGGQLVTGKYLLSRNTTQILFQRIHTAVLIDRTTVSHLSRIPQTGGLTLYCFGTPRLARGPNHDTTVALQLHYLV
jgi:hypothetical protein